MINGLRNGGILDSIFETAIRIARKGRIYSSLESEKMFNTSILSKISLLGFTKSVIVIIN